VHGAVELTGGHRVGRERARPEAAPRWFTRISLQLNAVIVVLEGKGSIGAEANFVTAGDVVWLTHGESGKESEVAIRAQDKPLRALLYAGRLLHEAVVARGPFVMNTEAEIEQAYADYRAGRFGPI
jgi:quercetin 2,3-dioxygenase